MIFLNSCVLLGRYRDVTIIDDNLSFLVLIVKDDEGDITIPVFIGTQVANQILKCCHESDESQNEWFSILHLDCWLDIEPG